MFISMILRQQYIITFANGWGKKPFTRVSVYDGGGWWREEIGTLLSLWKRKHILRVCHATKSQLCRIYEYILLRHENCHWRKSTTWSPHTRRTRWETYLSVTLVLTCGVTPLKKNKLIQWLSYLIFDLHFLRDFSIWHAELFQFCQWVPWERWDKTTNIT